MFIALFATMELQRVSTRAIARSVRRACAAALRRWQHSPIHLVGYGRVIFRFRHTSS
jgi:hypothetical protein